MKSTTQKSVFMQMYEGTRTNEGSFTTGLYHLFFKAGMTNKRKLMKAFPDFFGHSLPEFGVEIAFSKSDDPIELMRGHLREYQTALLEQCAKSPWTWRVDVENYSDSYIWLRLPIPYEDDDTAPCMTESDPEFYPNEYLAGLLLKTIENGAPEVLSLNGIGVDRVGSHLRFCISGAMSLVDLQNAYAGSQASHDSQDKK